MFKILSRFGVGLALLGGCAVAPLQAFKSISKGYDKADVLEILGHPNRFRYKNGVDEWFYVLYQDRIRFDYEIDFVDGIVVYKGPHRKPFISAEDQDEINRKLNAKILDFKIKSKPIKINTHSNQ